MMMIKMIMIIMWENFNSKLCFEIIVSGKIIFFIPSDKILIKCCYIIFIYALQSCISSKLASEVGLSNIV